MKSICVSGDNQIYGWRATGPLHSSEQCGAFSLAMPRSVWTSTLYEYRKAGYGCVASFCSNDISAGICPKGASLGHIKGCIADHVVFKTSHRFKSKLLTWPPFPMCFFLYIFFSMQPPEVKKSCCEMREGWYVISETASWRVLKTGAVPFCSKDRAGRRSCYQFLAGDPSVFVAIITIFNRILHWDKFSSVLVCSLRKQEIIVQDYVLLMSLKVPNKCSFNITPYGARDKFPLVFPVTRRDTEGLIL
jgi:hypothetical protein